MAWKKQFGLLVPYQLKTRRTDLLSVWIILSYKQAQKPSKAVLSTPVGDVDNLAKSILDALQDCGCFDNDRQVVDLHVRKQYGTEDYIKFNIEKAPNWG